MRVVVSNTGVGEPASLTDPIITFLDNNPHVLACKVTLNPSDSDDATAFIKKSCSGPSSLTPYYLREAAVSEGVFGIDVSGDSNPGWLKWEGRSQQVGKEFLDTLSPVTSLSSKSPWEWQGDLEGYTLPTWYKATANHPAIVLPPSTLPLIGDAHGRVEVGDDVLGVVGNEALPLLPKCRFAYLRAVFSTELMGRIAQLYAPTPAQGINIFNGNWPSRTRPVDAPVRIMYPQADEESALHKAEGLLTNLYRSDLGLENPVFNVVCFIVVKKGTTHKQCWHRDVNKVSFKAPTEKHFIALFPVLAATPSDGNSGDFVLACHLGLPYPFKILPVAPLALGDVWCADAKIIHRGGVPPLSCANEGRVYAFIAIESSKYEYDNTCPVVLPPWAHLEAEEPDEALCGHLGCESLLDLEKFIVFSALCFCFSCCLLLL